MRAVIDTNIFINSWFDDKKSCNEVLSLIERNKIKLSFSQETIGELMYMTKKYSIKYMSSFIPRQQLLNKVSELFLYSESVNTSETSCPEVKDKLDEMFVKTSIENNVDYLITDDFRSGMHSLKGLKFRTLSSEQFMELYNNDNLGQVASE